jgi:PIN domain nuclease of toxin-antitoxin system
VPLKYLLDTHIWLWMVDDPQRIPDHILPIVLGAENYPFYLSAISVWEVAKKVSLGKLQMSVPVRDWMMKATRSPFIEIVPLSVEISLESTVLPGDFHRDPADQMIVATARNLDLVLLMADQKIIEYEHVKTL